MSPTDTVIVGLGMTTAVGLSAAETSASVRSNVMRERAHKFYERCGFEHYKTQKSFRKPL